MIEKAGPVSHNDLLTVTLNNDLPEPPPSPVVFPPDNANLRSPLLTPSPVSADDFSNRVGPKLSEAQTTAIVNEAHARYLKSVKRGNYSEAEERAFLNGVACALISCQVGDRIPVEWSFPNFARLEQWLESLKANGMLHLATNGKPVKLSKATKATVVAEGSPPPEESSDA